MASMGTLPTGGGGTGMGPRIREDNGGRGRFPNRPYTGMVVGDRVGSPHARGQRERGDGSPRSRGQGRGGGSGVGGGRCRRGEGGRRWVPAFARTTGRAYRRLYLQAGGSPHARGQGGLGVESLDFTGWGERRTYEEVRTTIPTMPGPV